MFFQAINRMITAGTDLSINIRQADNRLTVAVMPRRTGLKGETGGQIVPLVLNGTPEELDMEFLQAISVPVQKAQGILTNLETFEKQAEQAASQNKAAKPSSEKDPKEVREKREKMERLLKKADEATAGNRYSEALTWLKQAKVLAVPDRQKDIDAKMAEVQKKAAEGSLFGAEPPMPVAQPQQTVQPQQAAQPARQQSGQPPVFGLEPAGAVPQQQSPQPVQYAQPVPPPQYGTDGRQAHPYAGQPAPMYPEPPVQASQPMPQGIQSHQPVHMQQPMYGGGQWQQPVPARPQNVPVQTAPGNNGNREYKPQPQEAEMYSFDKDDECDRERLREDPYAEYLDFPEEYRMKDEAQMELVCC